MSKPLKKGTKILIGVLIASALMAACFLCVALYAKNEVGKERSWLPPKPFPQQSSVTELPDNASDAYAYVMRLYDEALHADVAEISRRTDVDLGGDAVLPFGDADNAIIDAIRGEAAEDVRALYPALDGVKAADVPTEDLPVLDLDASEILEYRYDAANVFNRKGEYNSDTYEIVFQVDPSFESADKVLQSGVYAGICDKLKPALTVNSADPQAQDVEIRFYIDRLTDRIQSVEISRTYTVKAAVTLTDAYAAMLRNAGTKDATVELPYKATEHIDFAWYGLRFTEDYLEQKPGDIITLPLEIHVNGAAVQGEDFVVTYTVSDPQTMEIDEDALMTVLKTNGVSETEGVKVTASMTYEGQTYSDDLIVFITKMDKTTTGVHFWEDRFTVEAGQTAALPVYIRVPVNEQSEQRTEEEYSLQIDVSDPDALTVEADGKELFATGVRAAEYPVEVTVTMQCGGHTYTARIPVTVTQVTEAMENG